MYLILTHEHADFDAIASQLAVHKLVPEARPLLPNRLNRNVRHFMRLYWDALPFVEHKDLPKEHIDRAVVVDTQTLQTVRGIDKYTYVEIIDHHALRDKLNKSWQVTVEEVGATTTLLTERIQAAHVTLTPIEATLLALGIYEDTGSLSYGTTTARDVYAAAWLLEHGAALDVLRDFLNHPLAAEQRNLYERLLENVQMLDVEGHPVVVAAASAVGMVEEIATVAHKLRDLLDPAALFLLVQLDSHIQLVARSSVDAIDVGLIAEQFGGGGHDRAAAAVIRSKSLEEAGAALVTALRHLIRPSVTVAHLMSKGVQTLNPETTAEDAAEQMRRYGYEGFPVVDGHRIIGLLTRRAVDRALDHGLEGIRISEIMEAGSVFVSPTDSIASLQNLMMTSGWGQIPVVDGSSAILGVVTRTDLINHLGHARQLADRRAEIAGRMEHALPPALLALVRAVGRIAKDMDLQMYVVGGFVRDLLLGLPTGDMDFVVEGDAIALTRALQRELGGRIRSHGRFGTGKWLIAPEDWMRIAEQIGVAASPADLPSHIDFVSARREFYAAPTVLPEVERSSIKLDLHRRDFTINTLALSLDPHTFGQLLDFYGGESDLREKRIRVLHSLSFVDDPTRILRAVRLEQRLGFQIGPRTAELIRSATPLLERVSGDRIRHEIEFILHEARPEDALCRLAEFGVLSSLHPDLVCDDWLREKFADLRRAHDEPVWPEAGGDFDLELPYFALLTYRLAPEVINAVNQRIKVQRRTVTDLERVQQIRAAMERLSQPMTPSQIDALLDGAPDRALLPAWVAAPNQTARDHIAAYARHYRHVQPATGGADLIARGLQAGPIYSRVLRALRRARLDGAIDTVEQEQQLLEQLLTEER